MLTVISSFAQTRVVKGKLTTFNKYPVKNVAVESKKAGSTVMTDTLGQFDFQGYQKEQANCHRYGIYIPGKPNLCHCTYVTRKQ